MARITTPLADHLLTIPAIVAIAGQRVLDFDYRASGWQTAPVEVLDADNIIMPTLIVDDGGSAGELGEPTYAESTTVNVWGFGTRSRVDADAVAALLQLAYNALDGYTIPSGRWRKSRVTATKLRLGETFVDDGVMDRRTYMVRGIPVREEV